MKTCKTHTPRRMLALLLVLALCLGLTTTAFAAQENSYHDPAEHWLTASNRTNELDANAVVTTETFYCAECGEYRSFTMWRTPEYTRDGQTALTRNVKYSDGTMIDGETFGTILDGTPGVDAYYTGYHWTKAICDTCGTINSNMSTGDYSYANNVYWLYDCAAEFMEELDEETSCEYVDSTYHLVTTTGGTYCCFCYGTHHTEESVLEKHNMTYTTTTEQSNLRFVRTGVCEDCGYTTTEYATAKAVVQSYLGTVDGQAHTIVVSDLSDSDVSVSIRYGLTANSCTMTSAPNYTEAGTNYVYYAITYSYKGATMTENGVAYVTLVEATVDSNGVCSCGCGDADCDCLDNSCSGSCCGSCSDCDHSNYYSYTIDATCNSLGYNQYVCLDCGKTWKSDYVDSTGHLYQYFTTSEATCETAGKTIGICIHCGLVTTETTGTTDHQYSTYTVAATCTSPGYTVHECAVCGDRYISDITSADAHNYVSVTTAATCESGGHTLHICYGCGSSFITDYTDPRGHSYVVSEITAASCNGAGVTQYKCSVCGDTYLVAESATGHTLNGNATCTEESYCLVCGVILALPIGHDYEAVVTEPTCTENGYTTYTCANCGDSYIADETKALGHSYVASEITAASCNGAGVTQYKCSVCGDTYLVAESAAGHILNGNATCTEESYCLVCGAILALPTGHDYEAVVTEPTCTEDGYTTYTCANCGDSYIADETEALGHDYIAESITLPSCNHAGVTQYICSHCGDHYLVAEDATGHTPGEEATCTENQYCTVCDAILATATGHTASDWILDAAPTTDSAGSKHKECVSCGEILETAEVEKLYLTATTDTHGEAVVGEFLVVVTDTNTSNPISNATVTLDEVSGNITVTLPSGRLLDYGAQTTVTVLYAEDRVTPVAGQFVAVTDANFNYSADTTDDAGQITVPGTSGQTNEDGKATVGYEDADGTRWTYTVEVEDFETGRAITDAAVTIGGTGNITVILPDGEDMDANNRILITVTDNSKNPQENITVIVKGNLGQTATGQTDEDGELVVPSVTSAYTDDTGKAQVGQYTVIVTDSKDAPVAGALVTLIESEDGDRFTVLLPGGRLLDAGDQTTVTVLNADNRPASGLNVKVLDGNGNHAAKDTDKYGKMTVPDDTGSAGEIIGKEDNTYNVEVEDNDGNPIDDADISIDEDGNVTVVLPDDVPLDEDAPITVIVTDNNGDPVEDVPVTVLDSDGGTAQGETDATGRVTVPSASHAAYIYGYVDGTVRPIASMTRSEAAAVFARILAEARGDELGGYSTANYDDVSADSWYYEYVAYLDTLGVVVGYGNGNFGPNDTISRYEFVTICARLSSLMEMQDGSDPVSNFSDVDSGHWAYSYVKTAAVHGWVIGYPDGLFHGENDISRAEVVTIVNRFLGRSADEDYVDANLDSLNTFTDLWNPHVWYYYDMMEAANSHDIVTGASSETWCD